MPTRRQVLSHIAVGFGALPLAQCTEAGMAAYDATLAVQRAPLPTSPQLADLVRYATLAPNSHNAQPWRFAVSDRQVRISPDLGRRIPVVDPDDHHLFVSLGCAAENMLIAGEATGLPAAIAMNGNRIEIEFGRSAPNPSPLFEAIPKRQSTRSEYDGRAVSPGVLQQLEAAAAMDGVSLILITDAPRNEAVLDFVVQGNSAQMDDPAFVRELKEWIRFNPADAIAKGDGLFSASSGNPTLPHWLGSTMFDIVFRRDGENRKYASQIRSSAGIAVFVAERNDPAGWVNVGRSFQRFALQATLLGIRHAHINQPVEVGRLRPEFARWLGIGEKRPDLVIRFGYAPPLPMSLRRPVSAVIDAAA